MAHSFDTTALTFDATDVTWDRTITPTPTPTPTPTWRGAMGLGIGIGLSGFLTMGGGGGSPSPTPTPTPTPAATLLPGADWDGTPGSGWTVGSPAPTRTGTMKSGSAWQPEYGWMHGTLAPCAHFVEPVWSDEAFFDDQKVMIEAYAANSTDGILGGIDRVEYQCEGGEPVVVTEVTLESLPAHRGSFYCAPYTVLLPHADIIAQAEGGLEIYATIYPTNPDLSPRVIGPLTLYAKSDWDKVIDITPSMAATAGVRYPNYHQALNYITQQCTSAPYNTYTHILLRYTEDAQVDISSGLSLINAATMNTRRGQVRVDGNGFDVELYRSSGFAQYRPGFHRLAFDRVKLDAANVYQFYTEDDPINNLSNHRRVPFYRSEIYSSNGRDELPGDNGQGQGTAKKPRVVPPLRWGVALISCHLHNIGLHDNNLEMVRGTTIEHITGNDIFITNGSALSTAGRPALFFGNWVNDVDPMPLRTPRNAIQLSYSGGGTSPHWGTSGGHGSRSLLLRASGATEYTVASTSTVGSARYTCQDAVDHINANCPGWSASLTANADANSLIFGAIGPEATQLSNQSLATPVWTAFWPHSDLIQYNALRDGENILFGWNVATEMRGVQLIFTSVQWSAYEVWNSAVISNALYRPVDDALAVKSQVTGGQRHVLYAHNTVPDQPLLIDWSDATGGGAGQAGPFTMDAYCRNVANVFGKGESGSAGTGSFAMHVKRNYLYTTTAFTGTNVSNNTAAGGNYLDDYDASVATAITLDNYTPIAGADVLQPSRFVTAEIPFDILGNERGSTAPPGAFS